MLTISIKTKQNQTKRKRERKRMWSLWGHFKVPLASTRVKWVKLDDALPPDPSVPPTTHPRGASLAGLEFAVS